MFDRSGIATAIKKKYGASLQPRWLEECIAHIEAVLLQDTQASTPASQPIHLEVQIRLVLEQLLHSEISSSCYPSLQIDPVSGNVASLPGHPGAFLQIQEIMDVGVSKHAMWEAVREKEDFEQRGIRPSYLPVQDDDDMESSGVFTATGTQGRASQLGAVAPADDAPIERIPKVPRNMLKLKLTDGKTRLSAIELTQIQQLNVELPIGTKVLVRSGQILAPTGLLCLEQNSTQVLGGAPAQYQKHDLKKRLESYLGPNSSKR
ncbi:hypothetical protein GGI25_006330 [Coemansia spiralis]|uniref:RecQ-mediated genome instability protein 1 n=2 Tax=Coemansia TaxID=4863 RepID=A0A9W8G2B3_9FUNG|nr:hypothetical protein BX070DRAFT_235663 [Coemansia spiralis]KAJ1993194.1 hypothetical protein EDC05_002270 [Coemansia umbellata]KAJ2622510.1 hypothetical protein GGI26_003237 [Coemansia sp. RSA 1358]KAJ2668851.1 hypothetical protein GGI25_006330 [Coemansia spiralis]